MYDLGIKTTFVHFRANGLTIKKIAEVMGINRTTLIQWNKELYTDIKIAERDEFEKIFEEFACPKKLRVSILAEQLGACYEILADKQTRKDNLLILKEIEKLTKLINLETEDKKYSSLIQKAEKSVNKDFPVIMDDVSKLSRYDEALKNDNEYFDDYDADATSMYAAEDKEMIIDKEEYENEEKYGEGLSPETEEAIEKADEQIRKEEEEELLAESKANCVVNPKAGKRSKRILNRRASNSKLRMKNSELKSGKKSKGKVKIK